MTKMSKGAKVALILGGLLLVAGVTVYAMKKPKKKTIAPVKKKTSSIVVGDSQASTPDDQTLTIGVDDPQHVTQLQDALIALHAASAYINSSACSGMKWPLQASFGVTSNGTFDAATLSAAKYYLNRTEIDLDYLDELRAKMTAYKKGDPCTYPLTIDVTGQSSVLGQVGTFFQNLFNQD